ncbi:DUF4267 domain-containing protein [Saccharopolyspora sp. NPDC002578]
MSNLLSRVLGVATAAYGAAVVVSPALLARPAGLIPQREQTPPSVAALCRTVGVRDVASGVAMATARSTTALRVAVAVRVASDLGDAVVLATSVSDREVRAKAVAVALTWGVLCGASALANRGEA